MPFVGNKWLEKKESIYANQTEVNSWFKAIWDVNS
jgi:hypothetical protein